jgi:hypothetical protein
MSAILTGVHTQNFYARGMQEGFDYWESKSSPMPGMSSLLYNTGFLQMEIIPEESTIFQVNHWENLYEDLKKNPQALQWRTPEFIGIPPSKNAGYVLGNSSGFLTTDIIKNGAPRLSLDSYWPHIYCLSVGLIASQDYMDLIQFNQQQGIEAPDYFIVFFLYKTLQFNVHYVLPGINHISSSVTLTFTS